MRETSGTFKETEIGPIPVDWDSVPIDEVVTGFYSGGTPSTKRPEFWDGDIHWTTSAYIDDSIYLRQGARLITSLGLESSSTKLVPKGNLLIGTRVGVGKVAINAVDVAISQDITGAIVDKAKIHLQFLAYAMRAEGFQKLVQARTRGTTIKGIPRKDLVKIPIPLPPLLEQRRIAHVLSTIQRAIAAQEDLITAARETKRSLMQRLFTYGPAPEPAPTKETEIGEIPEHWVTVLLGSLGTVRGGKRLPKGHSFSDEITPFPYIRVTDFSEWSVDMTNLRYLTPDDRERISRYIITTDDVFISIAGTIGVIGTIPESLNGANLTENAARIIIDDKDELDKHYLVGYLASEKGQQQIDFRTTKTSQPKLALTRIKQIPIPIPLLSEQQEVVSTLAAISKKLAAEEQRRTTLEDLFKSMLQQLMTGRIRINAETPRRRAADKGVETPASLHLCASALDRRNSARLPSKHSSNPCSSS